jgi:hypothetical protein
MPEISQATHRDSSFSDALDDVQGLADAVTARHVIGCHLNPIYKGSTYTYDGVAGNIGQALPMGLHSSTSQLHLSLTQEHTLNTP